MLALRRHFNTPEQGITWETLQSRLTELHVEQCRVRKRKGKKAKPPPMVFALQV
jgi:hypothetical protein